MVRTKKIKLKELELAHDITPRVESSRRDLHVPPKSQWVDKSKNTPYTRFIKRYENLDESIDTFNSNELVYYFQQCAEENGQRYYIANMAKDAHIFKKLKGNFSNREICGMIEFLFTSEQTYLAKNRLSPNLLASRWVNTIYEDYKLWVEDKYHPDSSNKKYNKKHEWSESDHESRIGGWE